MDIQKIEDKIDKVVAGNQAIDMSFGGVQFRTMIELMEFAKMMAVSDLAVPPHLRGNPGACLAICTKAIRNGFDPFALAEHSFAMSKEVEVTKTSQTGGRSTEKVKVDTIAYDSAVIRAVIQAHAPIIGGIDYQYEGEGDAMVCIASAKFRDGSVRELKSPTLGERKKAIGTSQAGNLKGSPLWTTKPRQQLGYDTGRDFCRLYSPETLLGWYDKDEFEENVHHAPTGTDHKPSVNNRLRGQTGQGRGFGAENVSRALEHKPAMTLDATVKGEPEAVAVGTQAAESAQGPAQVQAAPAEAEQLDLASTPESEIEAKKKAVANIDDLGDLKALVASTTKYLKEVKRKDLLADFLKVASDRERAITDAAEKKAAA